MEACHSGSLAPVTSLLCCCLWLSKWGLLILRNSIDIPECRGTKTHRYPLRYEQSQQSSSRHLQTWYFGIRAFVTSQSISVHSLSCCRVAGSVAPTPHLMLESQLAFTCCSFVLVLLGNHNELVLSGQSIKQLLMSATAAVRLSSWYKAPDLHQNHHYLNICIISCLHTDLYCKYAPLLKWDSISVIWLCSRCCNR